MNTLQQALIEKIGHDHGFENVLSADVGAVILASARHTARVRVLSPLSDEYQVELFDVPPTLPVELSRAFPDARISDPIFWAHGESELAQMLRRAAALARALPNQPAHDFEAQVRAALEELPTNGIRNTEIERLIRQRVGQQAYRQAMLNYWGNACAVTGISVTEILRASHAKAWTDCANDEERLDVFNGFLLCAHLDALFDRFLISFDDTGQLLIAPTISARDLTMLGLSQPSRLRWITHSHLIYLRLHREQFTAALEAATKA
ncbi:HNH endonuclease [Cupriavidus basilensis]|uniref:HNH endonuclease n=1 Tax=Cupriavidus basilensis TaxID=68895 RepID=A0ABT6AFN7_9BURK|nr:HNH endonuclease [Cupriavidus basilensis]MDF3831420.1 HNH endonuclease [Cupriavidus basilensis]